MEVLLVDAGLALAAIGLVSVLWPLRFLRMRSRRSAALVLGAGLLLAVVACALPVRPLILPGPAMELDRLVPRYQFGEHHEIFIEAPPERVYPALRAVTARDIRLFRTLTWIRSPRFQAGGPESILNPGAERPILDVALGSSFVLLHEQPGREIVVGTIVCCGPRNPVRSAEEFWAAKGSVARAVMSFHLEGSGGATRLVTQTRVHASDAAAERRFAAYWRVIYPGSALLRVLWLRAIRDRALAGSG
jgi:hypothetical protein